MTRFSLLSSAQLLTSWHTDLQSAGAQRMRSVLWTDGIAAHAVELHLDQLLMALLRPDTPQGERRRGAAAGLPAGRPQG